MRIGLLTTYLALGDDADSGLGQHYRLLADCLAARGHDLTVFYGPSRHVAETRDRLAASALPWRVELIDGRAPSVLRMLLRRRWTIAQLLDQLWTARRACTMLLNRHRRAPLDIVETHTYNAPAVLLLRRDCRPLVVSRVSTTMRQMSEITTVQSRAFRWMASVEASATNASDALVTHSVRHRDIVCAQEGYSPERFSIVPHGVADPGEPVGSVGPGLTFLYVGRFERRKGVDVLLQAIPKVAGALPDARFIIAGEHGGGELWRRFLAENPTLSEKVTAPGRVSPEELRTLYRTCSVFVAPSRYESFGLIYIEAMSHGRPVIGCRAGGIAEVVTDGVTGLLAEPGDVATLAECMLRLGQNASLRERMGRAARADFVARFSVARMTDNSERLYSAVARGGLRPQTR